MTRIGATWLKTDKNNEIYYSVSVDKEIQPFTITQDKMLILKPNKNKGINEKAPDFYLEVFCPDKEKKQKNTENTYIDEEYTF